MDWISVKDRLPIEVIDSVGCVNAVLAWEKEGVDCGYKYVVSNVAYFLENIDRYTHWIDLKEPEE